MWSSSLAADTEMAWQQVAAWQHTYDLLVHHEGRLKACRDELTYAWPPGRSPAATAFVEYIDGLLGSIRRAKEDAVANHRALAGVLTSLSATKADMAKLKAEWDKHQADGAYRAQSWSKAFPRSTGQNWQDELNEKGRERMVQNDQEVFEATQKMANLTGPTFSTVDGGKEQVGTSSVGGHGIGASTDHYRPGLTPGSFVTAPSVASVSAVDAASVGLAGVGLTGSSSSNAVSPSGSPMPIGVDSISGNNSVVGSLGTRPISPGITNSNRSPSGSAIGTGGTSMRPGVTGPMALGPARAHSFPGGSHPTGHYGPTRTNPIGGVIEGTRSTSGPAAMPMMGAMGAGKNANAGSEPLALLKWEVREGGQPVIEPAPERPFELGPAIGVESA
jgi:hypothetical protein